jgi:hypothetical protein
VDVEMSHEIPSPGDLPSGAPPGGPLPTGSFLPEAAAPADPAAPVADPLPDVADAAVDAAALAPPAAASADAPASVPTYAAPTDAWPAPTRVETAAATPAYAPPFGATDDPTVTPPGVELSGMEVLPGSHAAPPSRRPARTAVIATLSVLALLLVGGGAYGWTLLHRPDIQLARALDATKSQPSGGMTFTMRVAGAGSESAAAVLTESSIHYAWGPSTQQFVVTMQGKPLADVVTTPTHLTLQVALASIPNGEAAAKQLRTMANTMGAEGQALADLADGKPIGLPIGPGSDLQKLIDKAQASQGSSMSQAALQEKAAAFADSLSKVVRDNTTVTQAGSDANGDHFVASIPLAPIVKAVKDQLPTIYLGAPALSDRDLAQVQGKTLTADVWVRDGQVSRLEIPLASLADAPKGAEATIVVVMDSNGVTPPAGPVTEVSSSLLQSLTDPLTG